MASRYTYWTLATALLREITDLPSDPHELAGLLAHVRVSGHEHAAGLCPVSRYLKDLIDVDSVTVGYADIVAVTGRGVLEQTASMPTPEYVRRFLRRFDDGLHPELRCKQKPCAC